MQTKWSPLSVRMTYVLILLLLILVAGCGQQQEEVSAPDGSVETFSDVSEQKRSVDPAATGTLKGTAFFDGEVPQPRVISVKGNPECALLHHNGEIIPEEIMVQDGRLQNVFVYIKEGLEGYSFSAPSEAIEIDNKNCVYVPHVTGAQVDQPLVFLNSDSTLHNVHAFPKNSKPFNLGLPFAGMKQTKKFSSPEVMVSLKCDVHPWMLGYVGVLPHPYFGVTKSDGSFELKGLPPGEYLVEAWHEKFGTQSQKVTIGSQETKEVEFRFQ